MSRMKIADVSEQIRGVSYKPEDVLSGPSENAIGILRANNILDGEINFNDLVYVKKEKVLQKQMLRKGDILICASSGSKNLVGKAAQIIEDCDCSFGAFCKVIRPRKVDPIFLGMYFQSALYRRYISGVSQGANINNIKKEHIDAILINGYSKREQKKISELLVKILQIIKIRKQQLSALDILVKARFVEMFGDPVDNNKAWPTDKLKTVTSKIGSGATPKGGRESYQNKGISLIRSMNVHDGKFEYKDLAHITVEQAEQLSNVIVELQDVFINITGASVARSCVVPADVLPARVNQHVCIVRCLRDKLDYIFVSNMFLNPSFKTSLLAIGESGGATRQAITKQQLENLVVILPPIELQKHFAEFVKYVDKSKVAIQKSLDETQILFDSLMQKYFE